MFASNDTNLLICSYLKICDISNLLRTCTRINGTLAITIEKSLRQHMRLNIIIQSRKISSLNMTENMSIQRDIINFARSNFAPMFIEPAISACACEIFVPYLNPDLCGRTLIIIDAPRENMLAYVFHIYVDIFDMVDYHMFAYYNNASQMRCLRDLEAEDQIEDQIENLINEYRSRGVTCDYVTICCNQEIIDFIQNI